MTLIETRADFLNASTIYAGGQHVSGYTGPRNALTRPQGGEAQRRRSLPQLPEKQPADPERRRGDAGQQRQKLVAQPWRIVSVRLREWVMGSDQQDLVLRCIVTGCDKLITNFLDVVQLVAAVRYSP
jgi:hypothetical protein